MSAYVASHMERARLVCADTAELTLIGSSQGPPVHFALLQLLDLQLSESLA